MAARHVLADGAAAVTFALLLLNLQSVCATFALPENRLVKELQSTGTRRLHVTTTPRVSKSPSPKTRSSKPPSPKSRNPKPPSPNSRIPKPPSPKSRNPKPPSPKFQIPKPPSPKRMVPKPTPAPKPSCYRGPYTKCNDPRAPLLQRATATNNNNNPTSPARLLPNDGSVSVIPPGTSYYLSGNYTFESLIVIGKLVCGPPGAPPKPINLAMKYMLIQGSFFCGRPGQPYTAPVTITLSGNGVADGTKAIIVTGNLTLTGTPRSTWTSITSTIRPKDKTFTTQHKVDWKAGDRIIVTPTGYSANEIEMKDIRSVEDDPDGPGSLVTITSTFKMAHWGEMQYYSNPDGWRTWEVDERAQVALMSRNIVITGDTTSDQSLIGGVITIMEGGNAWVRHVQMRRMGQAGALGSYPIHWHLLGNRKGNYVSGSVIWKSWNRCVTIHGTDNVLVDRNVCYDHVGHGFMLEDNCEINNMFRYNLAVITRKPQSIEAGTIDTDFTNLGTFWVVNPLNHFIGNVVAASAGAGFWMTFSTASINHCLARKIKPDINPSKTSFGIFRDNLVHSSYSALAMHGAVCNGTRSELCYGTWAGPDLPLVQNLTAVKVSHPTQGTWVTINARVKFQDCKWADNAASALFSGRQTVHDSLFVGESANTLTGNMSRGTRYAYGVYDGPGALVEVHFAGFPTEPKRKFTALGVIGAEFKSWPFYLQGVTFEPTIPLKQRWEWRLNQSSNEGFNQGIIDPDGVLSGTPNSIVFPPLTNSGLSAGSFQDPDFSVPTDTCTVNEALGGAYVCPDNLQWGQIRLLHYWPKPDEDGYRLPIIDVTRSDGRRASLDNIGVRGSIYFPVILNLPWYSYKISYLRKPNALMVDPDTQVPSSFKVLLSNCDRDDSAYLTFVMPPKRFKWNVCQGKTQLVAPTTSGILTFIVTAGGPASGDLPNLKFGTTIVRICASGLTASTAVDCTCR